MRSDLEIEADLAALKFHRLNPGARSVEIEFAVKARLLDDIADLFAEVKRMRAESTRIGLVAAGALAERYNAIEAAK